MTKTTNYNKHNSFLTIRSNKTVDEGLIVKLIKDIYNNNKHLLSGHENKIILNAINELDKAGGKNIPVMLMIESPKGVLHAEEIAATSSRIACLILATSDLISQLHARTTQTRVAVLHSLSRVILAARAYDLAVIDGIHSNLKATDAFEYACRIGRDMGFDGKSLVHPDQLPYANDAYSPKLSEVKNAREIISSLAEANATGRGTVVVNDRLVEHHHVNAAKRLLGLHELIEELSNE